MSHLIVANRLSLWRCGIGYFKGFVRNQPVFRSVALLLSARKVNMAATPRACIICDVLIGWSCSDDWQPGTTRNTPLRPKPAFDAKGNSRNGEVRKEVLVSLQRVWSWRKLSMFFIQVRQRFLARETIKGRSKRTATANEEGQLPTR